MSFREDIDHLVNQYSLENGSNTPDFVLSEYIQDCLTAFDNAVQLRERWYGRLVGQEGAILSVNDSPSPAPAEAREQTREPRAWAEMPERA